MRTWIAYLLVATMPVIAVIGGVAMWMSPDRHETLIELLRVFVSWPIVALLLGLVFKKELANLVANLTRLQFPGGEVEFKQEPSLPTVENDDEHQPSEPTPEDEAERQRLLDEFQSKLVMGKEAQEQLKSLKAEITQLQLQSTYWFFRYVSVFLVPRTQEVLRWFGNPSLEGTRQTRQAYDQAWQPLVWSFQERQNILSALLNTGLLDENPLGLSITPLGREFVKWQGPKSPTTVGPPILQGLG